MSLTRDEFNIKYKDFLVKGFYGLALNDPDVIEIIDSVFEKLIKLPGFKYYQIKLKFGYPVVYLGDDFKKEQESLNELITSFYLNKKD